MSNPSVNTDNAAPQFASISEIARMLSVDKAAISRKVARLETQGLVETRPGGKGEPKMVNVAAFLAAAERTTDAIRTANGVKARSPQTPDDPVLSREQARGAAIRADLAQIELDKQRGLLIPVDQVRDAMARAAGELVRVLETLPAHAAEIAAAVVRDGEQGVRGILKDHVRNARERLAAAMTLTAHESEAIEE